MLFEKRTAFVAGAVALACVGLVTLGFELHPVPAAVADLPRFPLVTALTHWDAVWYVNISRFGYWYLPNTQSPVAFFPGYPLLIWAASQLGANPWVAAIVLSLTCGLAAVVLFKGWADVISGPVAARSALLVLALYPFAFYLYGVPYSDGLYLALAIGSFLALEKRHLVWATLLGALATGARPMAPALVLGLLVRSIELRRASHERLRPVDFLPTLAVAGFAAYCAYLSVRFGDALAFATVQGAPGWDQAPGWHTWLKQTWFDELLPRASPWVVLRLGGHALVTAAALALVPSTWRRLGAGYALYVAVAVGLPALASKDFHGLGRYVLAAFPLFLTAALVLGERPRFRRAWVPASALALAGLAFLFGAGAYVA